MKAVIVDFDGTLFRGNSFEDCVLLTLKRLRQKGKIVSYGRICLWVALRKLRLISHARLKYQIQPLLEQHYDAQGFLLHLRKGINEEVWEECKLYRDMGYHLCLATAACDFYIKPLAELLEFDSYCATPNSQKPYALWSENRGETKKQHCLQCLARHNAQLELVITDHSDDAPLLAIAPHHIIIDPCHTSR